VILAGGVLSEAGVLMITSPLVTFEATGLPLRSLIMIISDFMSVHDISGIDTLNTKQYS
jgi:hypothetical protein